MLPQLLVPSMTSNIASLDAAATERKARLAKLASLKRKQPPSEDQEATTVGGSLSQPSTKDSDTLKHISGRNYDPETRGPKLGFENAPTEGKETLEDRAQILALAAREQEEREKKDDKPLDLFTLQPKKPNWDLKRDLAKKMELLDQRTDNAIRRMVKDRIEGQKRKDKERLNGSVGKVEGENLGIGGADLVEGVKVREREEEEEEKRERKEAEDD